MRISRFFDRIESKIFLIIGLTTLASSLVVFAVMFRVSYMLTVNDVHTRTASVNSYAQSQIPLDAFRTLSTPACETLPVYKNSQALLDQIRQIANVRYLFTAKRNDEGKIIYIIDGLQPESPDFRHIGDLVEDEILPELNQCFAGKKVDDDRILDTSWGRILLTCWPKFDEKGNVAGAIVMEYDAEALYQNNVDTMLYTLIIAFVSSILFIWIASLSLRKVSVSFYKRLAFSDVLTGLNSRTAFERAMDVLVKPGRTIAPVFVNCDLNQLKFVNDHFGHAAGDAYLRKMGDVMRAVPIEDVRHYRTGGDEFVSMVRGVPLEKVERMVQEVHQRFQNLSPTEAFFDFAYGVAQFDPAIDDSVRDTLTRADSAMYDFKRKHRRVLSAPTRVDVSVGEDFL